MGKSVQEVKDHLKEHEQSYETGAFVGTAFVAVIYLLFNIWTFVVTGFLLGALYYLWLRLPGNNVLKSFITEKGSKIGGIPIVGGHVKADESPAVADTDSTQTSRSMGPVST